MRYAAVTDAQTGQHLACSAAACSGVYPDRRAACPDPQVCGKCLPAALGITYRQISHWVRAGYLRPEGRSGTGRALTWPASDAEIARRIGVLTAAGILPAAAHQYARNGWPDGEIAPGLRLVVQS